MSYEMNMYEPFYGSFVALLDLYNMQAKYDLVVTSPSGRKVHETVGEPEDRFHVVPYETGKYRFCLRLNQEKTGSRYVLSRELNWDLHIGHADTNGGDSLKEQDTQSLWHYVHQVDAQLQQLRSTQQYLYWRERRHRLTVREDPWGHPRMDARRKTAHVGGARAWTVQYLRARARATSVPLPTTCVTSMSACVPACCLHFASWPMLPISRVAGMPQPPRARMQCTGPNRLEPQLCTARWGTADREHQQACHVLRAAAVRGAGRR